ncbi:hypothetical protein FS837_004909 [Tulasnella sp. UAMH 9824]|nr:hypothetical protein FS837_004909 [Tulasnella sp. UAMH 9824]
MEGSVNKLPPELLVAIFHTSLGGISGWTPQKLHKLAKVCTRWRDIILGTPQLWCTIQSWQYPHQNERVIKRNPLGPLMVRSDSQVWLEQIAPQSNPSRWIGLKYDGQQYFPSLERIIQSTNDLQHLAIALDSVNRGSSDGVATNLTKLHTLHLRCFNIPWDTLNSLRLESLWLENVSPCPTVDQLLSVLRSSPCLRRLILRGFYAWGEFFSMWSPQEVLYEPQDSSPINLPHLEILIMGSVASLISHPLLWRLRVPSCKILHLDNCHSTHFATASSSELPKTIGRILVAAK